MEILARKRIALLGATGHIAQALLYHLGERRDYEFFLFARSAERLDEVLKRVRVQPAQKAGYEEFPRGDYDVVLNGTGIGDPKRLREAKAEIFSVTEKFDQLILEYLSRHPGTLYVNLSSGAVYGKEFFRPVDDKTDLRLDIHHLGGEDFYGIAKIHSEAKHRAFDRGNIVDLRIFGFFSRFINPRAQYFMNEVVACLQNRVEFVTGPGNMTRDFLHPRDLASLVSLCIAKGTLNEGCDVYSRKPAAKFEILEHFRQHFGLKYRVDEDFRAATATGSKDHYYSLSRKAEAFGYHPEYSTLETLVEEVQSILGSNRNLESSHNL
jgi:nucleoside-diphosphate-sugar epimerase